jgi:GNAT superfamily N-acetyltransferase
MIHAGIEIRAASRDDADALREIHRRASYIWLEDRHHLDAHPEVFGVDPGAFGSGHVRIACGAEGNMLGFATTRPAANHCAELEDLFVEPAAMRRGIGHALVEDAAGRGTRLSWTHLSVIAHPRTLSFYERAGFESLGPANTQFGPALRLRRSLPIR